MKSEGEREQESEEEEERRKVLFIVSLLFSQDHALFGFLSCSREKETFDGKKDMYVLKSWRNKINFTKWFTKIAFCPSYKINSQEKELPWALSPAQLAQTKDLFSVRDPKAIVREKKHK